jgi:hypothetical protein
MAICWGNALNDTYIDVTRQRSTGSLYHSNYGTAQPIPTNDSLYYGKHTFTKLDNVPLVETVDFAPAHIKLQVAVFGLSNTEPGTPVANYPIIRVNNLYPVYDFDRIATGALTSYLPSVVVNTTDRSAITKLNVLRFEDTNPITIDVVRSATDNTILYTVNLEAFMLSNSISIVEGDEVRISMKITFVSGSVLVTLDGWGTTPTTPG